MSLFQCQLYVLVTLGVLFSREWPRLMGIPILVKLIHILMVSALALLAVAGLHVLVVFVFRNYQFNELFADNAFFGLDGVCCKIGGVIFGGLGSVLFFSVMMLGRRKDFARRIVVILAAPYCALFPIMSATITGESQLPGHGPIIRRMTILVVALSLGVVAVYRSRYFLKSLKFA